MVRKNLGLGFRLQSQPKLGAGYNHVEGHNEEVAGGWRKIRVGTNKYFSLCSSSYDVTNRTVYTYITGVCMRVRVHWHFVKRLYSVSHFIKNVGWRVLRDEDGEQLLFGKVLLEDAKFVVSAAGKKRAIREDRRNVHAFVEGEMLLGIEKRENPQVPCGVQVYYSPFGYIEPEFRIYQTDEPIHEAKFVSMGCDYVYPKILAEV